MEKIGVKSIIATSFVSSDLELKRDFLIFDKILIDKTSLEQTFDFADYVKTEAKNKDFEYYENIKDCIEYNKRNIDFLEKEGLIDIINIGDKTGFTISADDIYAPVAQSVLEIINTSVLMLDGKFGIEGEVLTGHVKFCDAVARIFCISQQIAGHDNFFPVLEQSDIYQNITGAKKTDIMQFILKQLPVPADDVSWDDFIRFKESSQVQASYYRLMDWINQISKQGLTPSEFEDRYKALYSEYSNQFKIHKIKHTLSPVEILFTGAVDFFASAVSLRFTSFASTFFKMFKQNIELAESEQKLNGRELAYIYKANEAF